MNKIISWAKCIIPCLVLSANSAFADNSKGGFSLGSTRVIYQEKEKDTTFSVINSMGNKPLLIQSWISHYAAAESSKPPFIITPPLYRQDKGKTTLRILRNGGSLPDDRESVFWLNAKAIPASKRIDDTAGQGVAAGSVSFAYVMKIKLFYRPLNIMGDAQTAYRELSFSQSGNTLIASNPSAYYITINRMSVDGREVKDVLLMVPPKGSQKYQLPSGERGKKVEYVVINDQGGITQTESKSIEN